MAAQLAVALPESTIVGAFHHLPASEMEDLDSGLDADVVIFSDSDAARTLVAEIVNEMPGLRAVIAGSMSLASSIEAFTAVCISVNIRHKAHSYVKLAGLRLMQLYDSARRGIYPLEVGSIATLYSCGITPYDAAHLGHAFVYLAFDVLTRRLNDAGHEARCVRNVTDVDDDILRKARELGVNYLDLAAQEMVTFERDMKLINLLPVYSEPRATGAISEILTLIGETFDKGLAYEVDGNVYFEVSKFPRFGQVSHESRTSCSTSRRLTAASPTIRASETRSTSCCGSRRSKTSRPGSRAGVRAVRAGTSSARRSPCASSARRSTYTVAGRISRFPITSAKRLRAKRSRALRS